MERYYVRRQDRRLYPKQTMILPEDSVEMVEYVDAQRALDAERANRLAMEACVDRDVKAIKDLKAQLATLQAQLRQVEGASVPRSRYDALNKDWLEEKESARRLKEVLAQLCLEMECSRNSMFVQMAVNVRATLAAQDAGQGGLQ